MKRTVLITGGARGIGAACSFLFAKNSYFVIVNYNESGKEAKLLKEKIEAMGEKCAILKADLSKKEEVENMFFEIEKRIGFVDVLINNCGIAQQKLFLDTSLEDWEKVFYINLFSMFFCCKKILPNMIREKKGKIINISSVWGEVGAACETIYSSSKAAVIGFTKALAKEVALSKINVNCIAPGVIKTDMLNFLDEKEIEEIEEKIPIGKIGSPFDVANAALFLADEKSNYINGEILDVGGGFCR